MFTASFAKIPLATVGTAVFTNLVRFASRTYHVTHYAAYSRTEQDITYLLLPLPSRPLRLRGSLNRYSLSGSRVNCGSRSAHNNKRTLTILKKNGKRLAGIPKTTRRTGTTAPDKRLSRFRPRNCRNFQPNAAKRRPWTADRKSGSAG